MIFDISTLLPRSFSGNMILHHLHGKILQNNPLLNIGRESMRKKNYTEPNFGDYVGYLNHIRLYPPMVYRGIVNR